MDLNWYLLWQQQFAFCCLSSEQKRRPTLHGPPFFPADSVSTQQAPPVAQKRTPAPSTESLIRGQRPYSRTSSAKTSTSALHASSISSRDTSRPPSTIENHLDYLREPVVKTPTEPTRVKSPEGSVRSPDPINWTVPLDTGKTFSVTQSLKEGGTDHSNKCRSEFEERAAQCLERLFVAPLESARDSPMSDHSSHFDSVSGTAIHLGRNSRASSSERGNIQVVPLHQPVGKMSSLAKDAKECGPGLTKDSTLTRPAVPSSAASSSTARKKCLHRHGWTCIQHCK